MLKTKVKRRRRDSNPRGFWRNLLTHQVSAIGRSATPPYHKIGMAGMKS